MNKSPVTRVLKKTLAISFFAAIAAPSYAGLMVGGSTVFEQGFETDTAGWLDNDDVAGFGSVTRVATGTTGINSAGGSWHGVFEQTDFGPFTRFDGYRDTWTGSFSNSIAIYLDTDWSTGSGFDWSVAANGSDGLHQRDFIFHVTKDTSTGNLLVGGSNNTNFDPREDLETINNFWVQDSGWYLFEHVFYDNSGQLAVDLNLRSIDGSLLFTETRTNPSDTIPDVVGGNRYGWFTNIDVAGGIAVDDAVAVPAPATLCLLSLGFLGLRLRRKA